MNDALRPDARVRNMNDLLRLLDTLLDRRDDAWWNGFFADKTKLCPFFVDWPDETLVEDFANRVLSPGSVLELGCGNGRNAVYMASLGCKVDAVDFSETALGWAKDRAQKARLAPRFIHGSIFKIEITPASYDIVYDCGCFHHIAPHRRPDYLNLVAKALKPGGVLSLVCFRPEGGSGLTDLQVYEQRSLGGGLGYTEPELRAIFEPGFHIAKIRRMKETPPEQNMFGKDFLWAAILNKRE